ncbi:MAG: pyruvate dehydrogenase complex dihydrolipoamide acetyltransferase [Oligoflexus sp.]
MAEIIEMPKLSDTMEEGAVATWLKKEGEFIEEGEAFVEIETDKATMEYNSPEEGYLLKILVKAGESCDLNSPIAVLGEKDEKVDVDQLLSKGKADGKTEEKTAAKPEEKANKAEVAPEQPQRAGAEAGAATTNGGRLRASPLARKVAKENQLDLSQISGSGPSGRVVIRDVEEALRSGLSMRAPTAEPTREEPIASAAEVVPAVSTTGDHDIPNSMMRKTIAKRLLLGKNEAPHFYLTISVDMAKLIEWRKQLNSEVKEGDDRSPPKVSVNDLIVLAVARALVRHPEVNASWQGGFIRRFGSVDISMAVAIPDGLITPIIKGAHALGVREIARRSKELAKKAKDNSLKPEEFQGGTFSISNLGMMGIEEFTAIINPPQSAILAVGATIPTPWVDASGELVVQQRMKMTLSCDHRVIDGATGALFLQTLKSYLENPLAMLI